MQPHRAADPFPLRSGTSLVLLGQFARQRGHPPALPPGYMWQVRSLFAGLPILWFPNLDPWSVHTTLYDTNASLSNTQLIQWPISNEV